MAKSNLSPLYEDNKIKTASPLTKITPTSMQQGINTPVTGKFVANYGGTEVYGNTPEERDANVAALRDKRLKESSTGKLYDYGGGVFYNTQPTEEIKNKAALDISSYKKDKGMLQGDVFASGQPGNSGYGIPDTTAQRQQILDQMRQRLGIQKADQQSAILKSAELAKQDIQSRYLQGKAGELERLVNQGLASGMQGAEQSGQARNEILQRQLSSENQANAVTTQAQGDITALDRQYNDLIAQGDIEGAKQAIDDAWRKYEAQQNVSQFNQTMLQNTNQFNQNLGQQAYQFDTSTAQNQSQFEANQAEAQATREYQKQQDAIQLQYRAEQDAISNALNAKQISMQEAQNRQAKLNADRDYKLNVIQTNYSTQKPYYKAKSGGGGETEAQRIARIKKEQALRNSGLGD